MRFQYLLNAAALSVSLAATARAEPRSSVWLEEPRVQAPGATETVAVYEHRMADLNAAGEGFDSVSLRWHAGVAPSLELVPVLRFDQRGNEPLRLGSVGGIARGQVWAARDGQMALTAYGGYANDTSEERDHFLHLGIAGRKVWQKSFVGGDARLTSATGGSLDASTELWLGAQAGYVFLEPWRLSASLEAFWVNPLMGNRLFDLANGLSAQSASLYYGPSLSAQVGPLWTGLSAVTGSLLSDPASFLMVRWWVGVTH